METEKIERIRRALKEINAQYRLRLSPHSTETLAQYACRLEFLLRHRLVMAEIGLADITTFREAAEEIGRCEDVPADASICQSPANSQSEVYSSSRSPGDA